MNFRSTGGGYKEGDIFEIAGQASEARAYVEKNQSQADKRGFPCSRKGLLTLRIKLVRWDHEPRIRDLPIVNQRCCV